MSKVDPKLSVISLAVAESSAETLSLVQIAVVLFRIWALRFGMIRINGRFGSVSCQGVQVLPQLPLKEWVDGSEVQQGLSQTFEV